MAVFRIEKNTAYTVMSNHHLRDSALSLKAKGLLSQMLSLPDGWDYTLSGLAAINKEGVDAIRAAVQELEKAGYIDRRQTQDENGKFSGNEYVIHEFPVVHQEDAVPAEAGVDVPDTESAAPLLDFPITGNPLSEKPLSDNPTQLNKDILSKDLKKKNKKKTPKSAPDWKPERFAAFWEYYRKNGRGENKQAAIRAWDNLAPDDDLIDCMGRALKRQVKSPDWQAGFGIPHASTWLNNRRWEDEPKVPVGTRIPDPEGEYF